MIDKLALEIKRLEAQNAFLKDQHRKDLTKIDDYRDAVEQIHLASDILLRQIVEAVGEPVYDDDGTLIGKRIEFQKGLPEGSHIYMQPYEHYHGLDITQMYRIGIAYDP